MTIHFKQCIPNARFNRINDKPIRKTALQDVYFVAIKGSNYNLNVIQDIGARYELRRGWGGGGAVNILPVNILAGV